ncbi:isochorismatase [Sporothrix brasiliensis 5110]|uniref:Isochorismatase n=1 Tax=Sporothrix brasiliensis 5110 TaxID=1398154 RepID=A0A0C2IZ81_9PEZI|nr:isochorismatase [Sporothrix brasiliensis 5110]KIH90287.1 isochorismatase [Sporothrix brasiliensis 5110]
MASFFEMIGKPPATASVHDSTLLIVDAQNEYAEGRFKTVGVEQTRKAIHELVEAYRAGATSTGKPASIVHIVHHPSDDTKFFVAGTTLGDIFAELTPLPGEVVVHKRLPGSFSQTDLHEQLQKLGRQKLVIVGYMTHLCVSMTARQALELGYTNLMPSDAVGTRDIPGVSAAELNRVALAELADSTATIILSKDVARA